MMTTPGGAGVGPKPAPTAPEKAANSAVLASVPATPTPPTRCPFLNSGTPPGFTALGSESNMSALPVTTPRPVLLPLIDREGEMDCPDRNVVLNGHPRLVFSMP